MGFAISRYMNEDLIKLELETVPPEVPENGNPKKWMIGFKELLLDELIDVLDPSGNIANRSKLLTDFVNREKKASTGIGNGFAIPHIRSMQARDFMIGFGRKKDGYDFDAIDDEPVKFFFIMAAPPYDDNLYLRVFKQISEMVQFHSLADKLLEAEEPYDVIRVIRELE